MRIRHLVICLATLVILTGCTIDDVTEVHVGQDNVPLPTSVPASDFTTTPYPVQSFDLDGDGTLGPAEVKAAVISHSGNFEFAPGYEFDATRFGLDIDRILRTDWRTFSFEYPDTAIAPPQACSWVQYWLDSMADENLTASEDALDMLYTLRGNDALGNLAGPLESMIAAAESGDADMVQSIFTEANCHLTFFVPDWLGPQGTVGRLHW